MNLADQIKILRQSAINDDAIALLLGVTLEQVRAEIVDPTLPDPVAGARGAQINVPGPLALPIGNLEVGQVDMAVTAYTLAVIGYGGIVDASAPPPAGFGDYWPQPVMTLTPADKPDGNLLVNFEQANPDTLGDPLRRYWLSVDTGPYPTLAIPPGDYVLRFAIDTTYYGGAYPAPVDGDISTLTATDLHAWVIALI